ncbi:MAG: hypothetical protein AAB495_03290 [Patescibacteria group bacterium]
MTWILAVALLIVSISGVIASRKNRRALNQLYAEIAAARTRLFGLKEAKAVGQYLENAGDDAAAAVRGVVLGVLGYVNNVPSELAELRAQTEKICTSEAAKIDGLKAKVRQFESAIEDAYTRSADAENELFDTELVAEPFLDEESVGD